MVATPPNDDDLSRFFSGPAEDAAPPPRRGMWTPAEGPDSREARSKEPGQRMPVQARAALQRLLMRGVVLARHNEDHYLQLTVYKDRVKEVLGELGLSCVYQDELGLVVLMRPADTSEVEEAIGDGDHDLIADDDEGGYALLRSTPLKLLHSLVLMVLRTYYRERERQGDRMVRIDLNDLKDRVRPYWPLLNAERRSDSAFAGAISALEGHCILLPIRGQKDQREVSPAVIVALNIENAELMVREYGRLAGVEEVTDTVGGPEVRSDG